MTYQHPEVTTMTGYGPGLGTVEHKLLRSLFELSRADTKISVKALAFCADVPMKSVAQAISTLDYLQLVDAGRLRLSLYGLALAVCLPPLGRNGAGLAA